jgi:outer membrane receptor protein involved in Fe transport
MRSPQLLLLFAVSVASAVAQQPPKACVTTPTLQQSVNVTADRGLANINDSAASVATLSRQQLQQSPGLTLDDSLHQVAGFQLFRRSSTWTANPTTEGVSLRGLGSTAASRTLVISDDVPLNDPFGGWIHWNEIPTLAISQVQLLRGGASDLYGSSAIGGVINILPVAPLHSQPLTFTADASGASESTAVQDALLTTRLHHTDLLAAGTFLTTGGYIPIAPSVRGPIDVPANVTSQSARLELHHRLTATTHAFLRGNLLNESRNNGTPLQTNAARLWRALAGVDTSTASTSLNLRLFTARESYRQSFTSVNTARTSETLTKLQHVPTDQLGLAAHAAHSFFPQLTAALGLDLNDVRSTDDETAPSTHITTSTSARQRATGGYAEAIWQPQAWSVSASIRADSFRTFDAQQILSTSATLTPQPSINELVASPHLGLVFRPQARSLGQHLALTANAFRAFRGPTLNELYRTSQVGQQLTLANNSLLAERATGFELGLELKNRKANLRASYFWTEVNRPISAILITAPNTYQRQNLGQIRSRGLMLEAQSSTWQHLNATFGYQLSIATVTAFNSTSPAQFNLLGKWIPEVPRQSLTSTVNYSPRLLNAHLFASYTGQAFDDAANTFLLHPYARFDLSLDRTLPHNLSLFASAQNLLNRQIDSGRTPILTLASPRLVQAGLRYTFTR